MDEVVGVFNYILENGPAILAAVIALLGSLTALALLIPGEQPEKSFKAVSDFLSKFSKK